MREIKFKAWHKKDNRMYMGWCINSSDNGSYDGGYFGDTEFPDTEAGIFGEVGRDGWEYSNPSDVELMQFTGLSDSNGIEIYEGDILLISGDCSDRKREVKFEKGGFVVYDDYGDWDITTIGWAIEIWKDAEGADYTVIGNIYEHPDLLKGTTNE